MDILSYLLFLFVGLIMGLLGGGGSILMVPVLVYVMDQDPVSATGYSLFIVGVTSLTGALAGIRKRETDWKAWLYFGLPSLLAVVVTRKYLVPALPEVIVQAGALEVTRGTFILLLFASLMLPAAWYMLRGRQLEGRVVNSGILVGLVLPGTLIGVLTSLVGAGGGFMIVPSLTWLTTLGMRSIIATSLLIIASSSLIGFATDLTIYPMNWALLLPVTLLSIAGVLAGQSLNRYLPEIALRKSFGWLVLLVSGYIFFQELIGK